MRCAWIDEHRDSFPITAMRRVLQVSRSGFYAWRKRPQSRQSQRRESLLSEIKAIHQETKKNVYGSPRIHRELKHRQFHCCENTVAKVMKEGGIQAKTAKKFKATTDSKHPRPIAANVLDQQFEASRVNEVWLADKQLRPPTGEGGGKAEGGSMNSGLAKVGCTWLPSRTCTRGRSWAGRFPIG